MSLQIPEYSAFQELKCLEKIKQDKINLEKELSKTYSEKRGELLSIFPDTKILEDINCKKVSKEEAVEIWNEEKKFLGITSDKFLIFMVNTIIEYCKDFNSINSINSIKCNLLSAPTSLTIITSKPESILYKRFLEIPTVDIISRNISPIVLRDILTGYGYNCFLSRDNVEKDSYTLVYDISNNTLLDIEHVYNRFYEKSGSEQFQSLENSNNNWKLTIFL